MVKKEDIIKTWENIPKERKTVIKATLCGIGVGIVLGLFIRR